MSVTAGAVGSSLDVCCTTSRKCHGIRIRLEAGDKSGSGHYPGRSTYGGDRLPGAFGSRGVSGQWTKPLHGLARPAWATGPRSPRAAAGCRGPELSFHLRGGAVAGLIFFMRGDCGPPRAILCGLGVYLKPALSIKIMNVIV